MVDPTPSPSPEAPSPGAPVAPSPAPAPEAAAGAKNGRDARGRILPGHTGNPKGRPQGVPNLNAELIRAIKRYRLGDKTWLQAILSRALTDNTLAKLLLDKIFVTVTPTAPAVQISNRNSNQQQNQETHVQFGAHLEDPAVRSALADVAQRLADRGGFSGGNGHVRE